jgi:hypothetical protein
LKKDDWFRFYNDAVNDPKIARLSDKMFRAWVAMLCFASKNEGVIPKQDVGFLLRLSEKGAASVVDYLLEHNLLEDRGDVVTPHNWYARQYKSDVTDPTAADRQKRYRKKRNADRNGTVTQTVTVTATRSEQSRSEQKIDSADAVHAEFLLVAKTTAEDHDLFGSHYGIQGMLGRGFSRETILAGAANAMRGKARPPTWNYFAKCIESENEQRSAPAKKEINNGTSGNVLAAADKLVERMRQFDEPSGVRSGEGATAVRLLPEGRSERP